MKTEKRFSTDGFAGFYYAVAAVALFSVFWNAVLRYGMKRMLEAPGADAAAWSDSCVLLSDLVCAAMYVLSLFFICFTIRRCRAARAWDEVFTRGLSVGIRRFAFGMLGLTYLWSALDYAGRCARYEYGRSSGCADLVAPGRALEGGTMAFLLLAVLLLFVASLLRAAARISREQKYTI